MCSPFNLPGTSEKEKKNKIEIINKLIIRKLIYLFLVKLILFFPQKKKVVKRAILLAHRSFPRTRFYTMDLHGPRCA